MTIEQKIQNNVNLADHTTFCIGGPAKFFVEATSTEELTEAVAWAQAKSEPIFILGGGSNVLVNDEGVKGLVIKLANTDLSVSGEDIMAGAGTMLGLVVEFAKDNNLTGLEWAVGIPGTIGGGIRGNAGAYGGCLADNIKEVLTYDMVHHNFVTMTKEDCNFGYRDSIFKHGDNNLVIWQVTLSLSRGVMEKIKAMMVQYRTSRLSTQTDYPSAGCVFKNLTAEDLAKLSTVVYEEAKRNGKIKGGKLACGYIIDLLGLKGQQVGGAIVGPHHGNFIVNKDKAKATDVQALIAKIKQQVKEKFGIDLQEEVQYFGF
ncbi:MAG: UDP-N-acetylmuramate dehydrogenase [bacterium]